MKLSILIILMFVISTVSQARNLQGVPYDGIDAMQRMDITGLTIIESDGEIFLASKNMHYVIVPEKILDVWNGIEVKSISDLSETKKIPIDKILGSKIDELGMATVGEGERVIVFLDAVGDDTKNILTMINGLKGQYKFLIVFLPARAAHSKVNQLLICQKENANAFIDSGGVQIDAENVPEKGCGMARLQKNMVTAKILGIDRVATTIAPNGVSFVGSDVNLEKFLADNKE